MNQIFIRDYTVISKHGYYKEEHYKPQRFVVSVICDVISNTSGVDDDLSSTLNYEFLRSSIDKVLKGEHHKLLESLCEDVASLVLAHDKVNRVEVTMTKPDIWGDCSPGVMIVRGR